MRENVIVMQVFVDEIFKRNLIWWNTDVITAHKLILLTNFTLRLHITDYILML